MNNHGLHPDPSAMIRFNRNDKTIVTDRDELILIASADLRIRPSSDRVMRERSTLIS